MMARSRRFNILAESLAEGSEEVVPTVPAGRETSHKTVFGAWEHGVSWAVPFSQPYIPLDFLVFWTLRDFCTSPNLLIAFLEVSWELIVHLTVR